MGGAASDPAGEMKNRRIFRLTRFAALSYAMTVRTALLRLGQVLSLAALLATCGGHWVVLQSFAWARMLVTNVESSSLSVAVERTFDGNHPCEICKSIASAKGKETKQQRTVVASKLILFCEEARVTVHPSRDGQEMESGQNEAAARSVEPLERPPSVVLG